MFSRNQKSMTICWRGAAVVLRSELNSELCPMGLLFEDFAFLKDSYSVQEKAELRFQKHAEPKNFYRLASWKKKKVGLSRFQGRWVQTSVAVDGSWATVERRSQETLIHLFCRSKEAAYELGYLYALSLLGECHERIGYVRLHGVIIVGERLNHAVLADSGCGKSSLAYLASQMSSWRVLADEMFLWRDGLIVPVPLLMCVPEKCYGSGVFSQAQHRMRSFQKGKFLLPVGTGHSDFISGLSFYVLSFKRRESGRLLISLLLRLVSGRGLPQMVEVYLRPASILFLVKSLAQRSLCACRIWRKGVLEICANPYDSDRARKALEILGGRESSRVSNPTNSLQTASLDK